MLERRVGLAVGVIIIFFVMYLVARNEPFASPALYQLVRIIISLAMGTLVATIPGFLGVKLDQPGLSIRAGGGAAAFLLTFFFSPGSMPALEPPNGKLSLYPLKTIDFRTMAGPDKSEDVRLSSATAVTIAVAMRNEIEPAKSVRVEATSVSFSLDGKQYRYKWRDFVKMHEENFGKWLGKEDDAAPFAIPGGQVMYKEVLHTPDNVQGGDWGDFLDTLMRVKPKQIDVTFEIVSSEGNVSGSCRADMTERLGEIAAFRAKTEKAPGRITTICEGA